MAIGLLTISSRCTVVIPALWQCKVAFRRNNVSRAIIAFGLSHIGLSHNCMCCFGGKFAVVVVAGTSLAFLAFFHLCMAVHDMQQKIVISSSVLTRRTYCKDHSSTVIINLHSSMGGH